MAVHVEMAHQNHLHLSLNQEDSVIYSARSCLPIPEFFQNS